jgi:hypothetical protein
VRACPRARSCAAWLHPRPTERRLVAARRPDGFALLSEQQRGNNPNLCFNWFVPGDIARHGGEALSIGT